MKLKKAIEGFNISRLAEGYSPNTMVVYRWALDRLNEYLEFPEIEEIEPGDLRRFMYYLRIEYQPNRSGGDTSPLTPSSIENAWKAIRSLFNWAELELGIERPDNQLSRPEYRPPVIQPFTEEEIRAILKACDYTIPATTERRQTFTMRRPTGKRDRALVLLLLDTGLRAGEAARLKIRDINLNSGEVYVCPFGSGRKTRSRTVYLGKVALRAVWLYWANRDTYEDNPAFLTEHGRPMDRNSIRHVIVALGERAEVSNVYPHRFRHTFAIQYLRNGGDVFTLQRLLGHSSLEMVKKYLALADADAASAHRKASPADRWHL